MTPEDEDRRAKAWVDAGRKATMTPAPHPLRCACDSCARCDPLRNETSHQCPVKTGELKVCDQFRCWICNEHFYNLEKECALPTSAGQVLEEILRPDVLHFALAMEKKLRKHDNDRNGWKGAGINWLFERLLEGIEELRGEVSFDSSHPGDGHPDRESVDVGNFGMMIHSNTATTTIGELVKELRSQRGREP